jgi:hypothetical protein
LFYIKFRVYDFKNAEIYLKRNPADEERASTGQFPE